MASTPKIFGEAQSSILSDIGIALLQVKTQRGLSAEDMRVVFGLRGDDMVSKYIAGESEMGIVAWMRANEAWPELADKLEETAAERALRSKQIPLPLKGRK